MTSVISLGPFRSKLVHSPRVMSGCREDFEPASKGLGGSLSYSQLGMSFDRAIYCRVEEIAGTFAFLAKTTEKECVVLAGTAIGM